MKLNTLTKSIALGLAVCSVPALALETTAEMHGYIKAGLLANADGTRANSVGLLTDYGKWRLGNEQNTKIELLPTLKMTTDDGTWAKARVNLTHETNCTSDWNCVDGDGHDIQFREGFVEMGGFDFAPESVFWAGKRYSSSNTSSHQFDWEYIQYNGTGGGIDKIDLGFAKMDIGVYAFLPSDRNGEEPVDGTVQGYSDDFSLNVWFKQIAGSQLDVQLVAHTMEEHSWHKGAATNGVGVTALYNFDGFYNLANGFSRMTLQYGEGLAAGDSLGKNGWGFANSEDTKSSRVVFDGVVNLSESWELSTFAFYQTDSDYAPWSDWSNAATKGYDRDVFAIGVRPHNQITKNFAMQYEIGYENVSEDKVDGADGGLYKVTVAPTLMLESGFWARPQIRAFVTYAQWDDEASSKVDSGYTRDGQTDTLNFGVQAEVWF
ncbi:carbohydrate porin [Vibrio sp. 10N.286.52.C3]|uniref:carbohydrate porin n=1 Tax=Vibrio TaxID=662 RepID=UPI00067F3B3E|nr:carbohydrate porin [Vibrio cyclitrophicus]KAA8597723.1 Maltoporin (maltose/maltodextrin high-affinity receptor phage lambda receptor protein) [Vibrio cyclitrophicus]KNH11913.1 maltoporin [Vibrio lentus]PMH40888.1 maltoporin [Vibrio cyclitrophicus]PMH77475.1 maltoporin [Vibrio cyclitrophicus]